MFVFKIVFVPVLKDSVFGHITYTCVMILVKHIRLVLPVVIGKCFFIGRFLESVLLDFLTHKQYLRLLNTFKINEVYLPNLNTNESKL